MGNNADEYRTRSMFGDRFEDAIACMATRYGIDCFYIGDSFMKDIGFCSLYIPLDVRFDDEKETRSFDEAIFNIDGGIIEHAQFNSVLLTLEELKSFTALLDVPLNLYAKNLNSKSWGDKRVYEIIAVNEPDIDNLENRIID